MKTAKMSAAAQIIMTGALEALARVHSVTVEQVTAAIEAGDVRVCEQFKALAETGAAEAVRLHEAGKISLV